MHVCPFCSANFFFWAAYCILHTAHATANPSLTCPSFLRAVEYTIYGTCRRHTLSRSLLLVLPPNRRPNPSMFDRGGFVRLPGRKKHVQDKTAGLPCQKQGPIEGACRVVVKSIKKLASLSVLSCLVLYCKDLLFCTGEDRRAPAWENCLSDRSKQRADYPVQKSCFPLPAPGVVPAKRWENRSLEAREGFRRRSGRVENMEAYVHPLRP